MQGLDERTRDLIQRRVLKRVNDIPSLPQFVIDTLKKLDDPKSSAQDVADKLSRSSGQEIKAAQVEKIFHLGSPDLQARFQELLANMPMECVQVSDEIISYAKSHLSMQLNQNVFTRALNLLPYGCQGETGSRGAKTR